MDTPGPWSTWRRWFVSEFYAILRSVLHAKLLVILGSWRWDIRDDCWVADAECADSRVFVAGLRKPLEVPAKYGQCIDLKLKRFERKRMLLF